MLSSWCSWRQLVRACPPHWRWGGDKQLLSFKKSYYEMLQRSPDFAGFCGRETTRSGCLNKLPVHNWRILFALHTVHLPCPFITTDWTPVLDRVPYCCVYMCRKNMLSTCRSCNYRDTSKFELLFLLQIYITLQKPLLEERIKNDVQKKFVCGTDRQTPWSWVFPEKPTGPQLVKKFPAFYGTRRFITALTNARHLSLS
jgi:hypothetical protein